MPNQSFEQPEAKLEVKGLAWKAKPIDPKDEQCVAKTSHDAATDRSRFWIKFCTAGAEMGRMYNPLSPMFIPASQNRYHAHLGKSQYEFKEVKKEAFEAYVRFMETENPIHLRHAERF